MTAPAMKKIGDLKLTLAQWTELMNIADEVSETLHEGYMWPGWRNPWYIGDSVYVAVTAAGVSIAKCKPIKNGGVFPCGGPSAVLFEDEWDSLVK